MTTILSYDTMAFVGGLSAGELRIEVEDRANCIACVWRGRSVERDASAVLGSFFAELLERAQQRGCSIEMDFRELSYFNSSTIGALISFIQKARRAEVPTVMLYDDDIKWQRLSFDAMRMFEKSDKLFRLGTT